MTSDGLMAVKVLVLVVAGGAFVWWQLRDLAQERRRTQERENLAKTEIKHTTGQTDK